MDDNSLVKETTPDDVNDNDDDSIHSSDEEFETTQVNEPTDTNTNTTSSSSTSSTTTSASLASKMSVSKLAASNYGSFRKQKPSVIVSDFQIVQGLEAQDFVNYIIDVQETDTVFGVRSWTVYRRFSLFYEMYEALCVQFEEEQIPEFPAKTLFRDTTVRFAESRRKDLQAWLYRISQNVRWWSSEPVSWFLSRVKPVVSPKSILIPLPDNQFDVTELSIPWRILKNEGFVCTFATENGNVPQADETLLDPKGVVFGKLGAEYEAKMHYRELVTTPEFQEPIRWDEINLLDYDGLLLVGGHQQGMRQYLESEVLQKVVAEFFKQDLPVGAICHGTLLAARSIDEETGKSVLFNRKTMTLPKVLEAAGWAMTAWKMGRAYRTYDEYCEEEVCSFLENAEEQYFSPFTVGGKGKMFVGDEDVAAVCRDGKYLSARWPGDAYYFGREFVKMFEEEK
eukprot:TRINITY_DN1120_c0_g1_i1.p1 TRINITY_DN1120_c0_g1~~TRINITY_DN1120_c0_g1_i1.p1  ORF type:complete len:453 (-),score=135.68 TRINITY_DN1120_c0_g1_i1:246-1604(-)